MPEPDERPPVQGADPAARRRAGVIVIVMIIAGALAHFALQEWLAELKQGNPARARESLLEALLAGAWISALLMGALAAWLWRQGGRIRIEARYPLSDAKLVRDTPILEGAAAQARGKLLQAFSIVLAVLALAEVVGMHLLAARLEAMS